MRSLARKLLGSGGGGGGGTVVATVPDGAVLSLGYDERTATVRFGNDGNIYTGDQGFFNLSSVWRVAGGSSAFEIRATILSGSVFGPVATWINLSTTRDWSTSDPTDDSSPATASVLFEIRNATSLAVLDSGTWTLEANRLGFL